MADPKASRWRNLFRPAPRPDRGAEPAPGSGGTDATLETALAGHERALREAAGDTSLCAIAKSGESWPAVKYHEGAVVALREVRRADDDRRTTAAHMLGVWRRAQAEATAAGMGGDWTAYRAGGIDALARYLESAATDPERP